MIHTEFMVVDYSQSWKQTPIRNLQPYQIIGIGLMIGPSASGSKLHNMRLPIKREIKAASFEAVCVTRLLGTEIRTIFGACW